MHFLPDRSNAFLAREPGGLQEDRVHFLQEPDELNPNASLNFIFLHLGWGGSCLFMGHLSI